MKLRRFFEGDHIPKDSQFVKSERLSFYDEEGDRRCNCPVDCSCHIMYKTVFYFMVPESEEEQDKTIKTQAEIIKLYRKMAYYKYQSPVWNATAKKIKELEKELEE